MNLYRNSSGQNQDYFVLRAGKCLFLILEKIDRLIDASAGGWEAFIRVKLIIIDV